MGSTADRVLDSAQRLAQVHGYNGFSYADISNELGITKASIHHHFASKAQLAQALVVRYRERFNRSRAEFDAVGLTPAHRLTGYAGLFAASFLDSGRMCLCGVFAVDAADLPEDVRREVAAFFEEQRSWVAEAFVEAGMDGARARGLAEAYLAALEGALLLARASAAVSPEAGHDIVPGVARTLVDALL